VDVKWGVAGQICNSAEQRLNLVLLPWPLKIEANAFVPVDGPLRNMDKDRFGFFDFRPTDKFDTGRVKTILAEAKRRVGRVHGIVLPEGAVSESDLREVTRCAQEADVAMIVAGVRAERRNYAYLGLFYQGKWRKFEQDKHHRWFLDEGQIHQYHLGSALHPRRKWWENMEVHKRSLNFVAANGWLTLCHLICEDLARQEPVSSLVRAVGPNLVIALLLDGPQLKVRWPARYASVLADDPGSSVLTVTSVGMAERSWSGSQPAKRVVALWKDGRRGMEELVLPNGHDALLLTLSAGYVEEWAADGRSDNTAAGEIVLSAVEPIAC
jgi:hypothetical protein